MTRCWWWVKTKWWKAAVSRLMQTISCTDSTFIRYESCDIGPPKQAGTNHILGRFQRLSAFYELPEPTVKILKLWNSEEFTTWWEKLFSMNVLHRWPRVIGKDVIKLLDKVRQSPSRHNMWFGEKDFLAKDPINEKTFLGQCFSSAECSNWKRSQKLSNLKLVSGGKVRTENCIHNRYVKMPNTPRNTNT